MLDDPLLDDANLAIKQLLEKIVLPALPVILRDVYKRQGQSGLDRLIAACYTLLGLISFLTAGADECRAWTIKRGTKAPQAAGKIHTDFERGFIRAEVVAFDDLKAQGGMAACREKGLVRSEGKDYVCLLYTSQLSSSVSRCKSIADHSFC